MYTAQQLTMNNKYISFKIILLYFYLYEVLAVELERSPDFFFSVSLSLKLCTLLVLDVSGKIYRYYK